MYETLGKLLYASKILKGRLIKLNSIKNYDFIEFENNGNFCDDYKILLQIINHYTYQLVKIKDYIETNCMNKNMVYSNEYLEYIESLINNKDRMYKELVECIMKVKPKILIKKNLAYYQNK